MLDELIKNKMWDENEIYEHDVCVDCYVCVGCYYMGKNANFVSKYQTTLKGSLLGVS